MLTSRMTPDTELDRKRLPRSVRLIISFVLSVKDRHAQVMKSVVGASCYSCDTLPLVISSCLMVAVSYTCQ